MSAGPAPAPAAPGRGRRRGLIIGGIVLGGLLLLAVAAAVAWAVLSALLQGPSGVADDTPIAAPGEAPQDGSRSAFYSFGHTARSAGVPVGAPVAIEERMAFVPTVDADRYRVVVRNLDYRGDEILAAPVDVASIYLGPHEGGEGLFEQERTVRLSEGGALADGEPLTTEWFDAGTLPLDAGSEYLLGIAFSAPADTPVGVSPGGAWVRAGASDGAMTRDELRGDFVPMGGYLDVVVEYSFDDPGRDVPVVAVLGHSLNSGANLNPEVPNDGEIGSWHQLWAQRNGGAAASLAAPGSWLANFLPDSPKWDDADMVDADAIVLWAASSDLVAGTPVDDVGATWVAVVERTRQAWPDARIITFTEPPRAAEGDGEDARMTWNEFLRSDPSQVDCVVDVDRTLADPDDVHRLAPELNGDDSHMSPAGHELVAAQFDAALDELLASGRCSG